MNVLFLPGRERSWWRGALTGSCWLLASWDWAAVEGHRVCWIDRIELLKVSPRCSPRWVFVTLPPEHYCSLKLAICVSHLQIDKGLAWGAVPFIKIKFDPLRTPWQRGRGRPMHGTFLEMGVPPLIILWTTKQDKMSCFPLLICCTAPQSTSSWLGAGWLSAFRRTHKKRTTPCFSYSY